MRSAQTPPERALWQRLRASRLGGYKFRRQAVLEPFIADFFCPAKGLIIELDGRTHDERDLLRDANLQARGFTTLRFGNQAIGSNLEGVLVTILAALENMPDRWSEPPHPRAGFAVSRPSPEGEG